METAGNQEEGWTLVRPKRRRVRSPRRYPAAARAQVPHPTTISRPQVKELPLFKVKERDMTRSFAAVLRIEKQLPDVRVHAKPNLKGEFVIRPSNEAAVNALRNISRDSLEELKPEEKKTKQVVRHYPVHMGLEPLKKLPFVISAERCKVGAQCTRQVIITCQGTVPASADLGIFGEFPIRPFNSEPIRCFRCQRYGHHQSTCTGAVICGVCSGRHGSEACIAKHKQGIAVRARCPNCGEGHHAWNPRCPMRLERLQRTSSVKKQQQVSASMTSVAPRQPQQTPRVKVNQAPQEEAAVVQKKIRTRETKQATTQTVAPPEKAAELPKKNKTMETSQKASQTEKSVTKSLERMRDQIEALDYHVSRLLADFKCPEKCIRQVKHLLKSHQEYLEKLF